MEIFNQLRYYLYRERGKDGHYFMKFLKPLCERILAILIICIPGVIAIFGWKWMRDILHNFFAGQPFAWLSFLGSLLLFLTGIAVTGSFIYYRDNKRNRIQNDRRQPSP